MTLVLRSGEAFERRVLLAAGEWSCPETGCHFHRNYATKAGAIEGASLHMKLVHRVRLVLPEFVQRRPLHA